MMMNNNPTIKTSLITGFFLFGYCFWFGIFKSTQPQQRTKNNNSINNRYDRKYSSDNDDEDHTKEDDGNMNGFYPLSKTPGASNKASKMPRQYKDYPGLATVEFFDVYSPYIETLYSQVWWKALEPVNFPTDIIERYHEKGMAILGWEIDQVRISGKKEVSVPISASYNHHYTAQLIGNPNSFEKVVFDSPDDPRYLKLLNDTKSCGGHAANSWDQPHYIVRDPTLVSPKNGLPTHHAIQSGNGGEYRKTFHGFSPGYALLIDSPKQLQITPMQIDTWNREFMDIDSGEKPPKFVPGPLPRSAWNRNDPHALHSGLLECPMTTRLTKVVDSGYELVDDTIVCKESIFTSNECFQAAGSIIQNITVLHNMSGNDPTKPMGCSYSIEENVVYFKEELSTTNNNNSTTASCSMTTPCICPNITTPFGTATGYHEYHRNTSQPADIGSGRGATFRNKCASWPATSILTNQKNPTCDIRYYKGGQWACHHMWSLLDADQDIPWTDQPLKFRHKYRFWVQPYDPEYHKGVIVGEAAGSPLLIGSPWEYDVPKCESTQQPGCELSSDGVTWVHTIKGNTIGRHTFVTLNNHCHAPTCLSVSVYKCPLGTPLEDCNEDIGDLVCETKPIYGGTSHPDITDTPRFDEPGYIAVPICVWGDSSEFGLEEPPDLDGYPLHIIKKANATEGHYGEMSGGQPWVIINHKQSNEKTKVAAVDKA